MRLEDESAVIREAFPAEYVDAAVFVTTFGGATMPMLLLALLFWLTDRRRSLLVVSYAIAGLGFLLALKTVLGFPRPPEELFLVELDGDGHGFPSGHAFAAVVVYGGLLTAFDRVRDWPSVIGVSALVVLVSLSRIVLGFHYLGDVIVGVALGVAFLAGMDRLASGEPRRGFAVAVVLAIPAVLLTGFGEDALLGLGGAFGGLLASARVSSLPELRSRLEGVVLVVAGLGFVAVALAAESFLESGGALATANLVALYAVLVAGIVLAPAAVGRFEVARFEIPFGNSRTDAD